MSDALTDVHLPEGDYCKTVAGHRIHYLDEGGSRDERAALLFLHGSGPGASGHSNFKRNIPVFAEAGYRCITPDHLGYGRSDKPEDIEYHIDVFVEAIVAVLDHLGLERCVPVGNSLGGAIALNMALTHPERIEKLILMAPGGIEETEAYFKMHGMAAMREFFMSGKEMSVDNMRDLLAHLVFDSRHIDAQLVAERKAVFETQNSQVMASMKVPNIASRLGEIHCPSLVFWGANETFMPLSGIETLASACPDARVVVQSNCGHWVMVEHARLFNRYALDFLANG